MKVRGMARGVLVFADLRLPSAFWGGAREPQICADVAKPAPDLADRDTEREGVSVAYGPLTRIGGAA